METLNRTLKDAGCRFYQLAANALNEIITLAHENRLTRKQYIMFALADMITHLEIGVSLARKASKLTEAQSAEAERSP